MADEQIGRKVADEQTSGKWLGRQPRGSGDTHSWKAFLRKTPNKSLQKHLARHHRGYRPAPQD